MKMVENNLCKHMKIMCMDQIKIVQIYKWSKRRIMKSRWEFLKNKSKHERKVKYGSKKKKI